MQAALEDTLAAGLSNTRKALASSLAAHAKRSRDKENEVRGTRAVILVRERSRARAALAAHFEIALLSSLRESA